MQSTVDPEHELPPRQSIRQFSPEHSVAMLEQALVCKQFTEQFVSTHSIVELEQDSRLSQLK